MKLFNHLSTEYFKLVVKVNLRHYVNGLLFYNLFERVFFPHSPGANQSARGMYRYDQTNALLIIIT